MKINFLFKRHLRKDKQQWYMLLEGNLQINQHCGWEWAKITEVTHFNFRRCVIMAK